MNRYGIAGTVTEHRTFPHAPDAERAVLGALLIDPESWDTVADLLSESDFYARTHQQIFRAIQTLYRQEKPVDIVSVGEQLSDWDILEDIGGAYALSQLTDIPSAANIEYYAQMVFDKSVLRRVIVQNTEIIGRAYDDPGDIEEILSRQEKFSVDIRSAYNRGLNRYTIQRVGDNIGEVTQYIENPDMLAGESTGITDLDDVFTLHLQRSYVIYGYSGHGKTTLGLNILKNRAQHYNESVAVFSLEMTAIDIKLKLLSMIAGVQITDRRKDFTKREYNDIVRGLQILEQLPLYISDESFLTVDGFRASVRELKKDHDVQRVLLDYLQLLSGNRRDERRVQIEEISRYIKLIAKESDVSLIAISNLTKPTDRSKDKLGPPKKVQLKGTSNIEYDADNTICVHNYYKEGFEEIGGRPVEEGQTLVRMDKHRLGMENATYLRFLGWRSTFGNLERGTVDTPF